MHRLIFSVLIVVFGVFLISAKAAANEPLTDLYSETQWKVRSDFRQVLHFPSPSFPNSGQGRPHDESVIPTMSCEPSNIFGEGGGFDGKLTNTIVPFHSTDALHQEEDTTPPNWDESMEISESDLELNIQQLRLNEVSPVETVAHFSSSEYQHFPEASSKQLFHSPAPTIWSILPQELFNLSLSLEVEIPDLREDLNGKVELRMEHPLTPSNRTTSRYFPYGKNIPSPQKPTSTLKGKSLVERQIDLNQDTSQPSQNAAWTNISHSDYNLIDQQTEATFTPW